MDIEVIAGGPEHIDLRVGERRRCRAPIAASSRRFRQWKHNGSGDSDRTDVNVRGCADDAGGRDESRDNFCLRIEIHRTVAGSRTRVGRDFLRARENGPEWDILVIIAPAARR